MFEDLGFFLLNLEKVILKFYVASYVSQDMRNMTQ